jgi:hypothetical protein
MMQTITPGSTRRNTSSCEVPDIAHPERTGRSLASVRTNRRRHCPIHIFSRCRDGREIAPRDRRSWHCFRTFATRSLAPNPIRAEFCATHLQHWLARGAELEAHSEDIGRQRGDLDVAGVIAGQTCVLVRDISPTGEIVERIIAVAERVVAPHRGSG